MEKEKIKDVERPKAPDPTAERARPPKSSPSTFDKVLERNRLLQDSPRQTPAAAQKESQEEGRVMRREEQGERGRDRDSDEKERDRGKERTREKRETSTAAGEKIIGKGQKKGSSGGEGGGAGRDRGFGRPFEKRSVAEMKKGAFARAGEAAGAKFAAQLKLQIGTAHTSREFVQQIAGQIVKFVRAGINKDGSYELRLDLHEKIFRGLKLRLSLKDGKVSVYFDASNRDVKALFEGNSEAIQKELEAKGISIEEIKVL